MAIVGHRQKISTKFLARSTRDSPKNTALAPPYLGHDGSIKMLKECYKRGLVGKNDFAAALRAHQAAVDATKSEQREAAAGEIPIFLSSYIALINLTFHSFDSLSHIFMLFQNHYTQPMWYREFPVSWRDIDKEINKIATGTKEA